VPLALRRSSLPDWEGQPWHEVEGGPVRFLVHRRQLAAIESPQDQASMARVAVTQGPHHRHHRPRRQLPGGIPAREGLHRARHQAPRQLFNTQRVDHIYQDPHVEDARFKLHYGDLTDTSNLTASSSRCSPTRSTTWARKAMWRSASRAPEYTADVDAPGHAAPSGGHPHPGAAEENPLLPGQHQRAVWPGAGNPPARDHALLTRAAPTPWPSSTPTGSP
jgi:hypothetical protein